MDIYPYLDTQLSFEERARDLVSRMTLQEKAAQMRYDAPAIKRLGVPSYNWWNEALHGVARAGVATIFPQAIGLAATFDVNLMKRTADIISTEARAKYHDFQHHNDHGIYKGLTFWSPNINIFRDPRWGRGHETYGEDPYLTSRMGVAFVQGMQGDDPKYLKSAACAKHFVVHSGPEGERHSFDAQVSQKDLYETYLPAFHACVTEGHVESIMGAYNRTNGEPCCGSLTLMKDILRKQWGFAGHYVSDCWAIQDFHEYHMITSTAPESAALAVNNGCDLNCGVTYLNLLIAHQEGRITEEVITESVTRLMVTRMKLGMFDPPEQVPYTNIPFDVIECDAHRKAAKEAAEKSMVLLRNRDQLLPLNRSELKNIAVIGPNADSIEALIGNYHGTASQYITVLRGIQEAVDPDCRVYYAQGCHLFKDTVENLAQKGDRISEAVSMAERADVSVVCLGLDGTLEGEQGDAGNAYASGDKLDLNLPGQQQALLEALYATGKPIVLVIMSGSALSIGWADEHIPAIVQAWYPGAQGGAAVASMIFGDTNPSGRLPVTFYQSTDALPDFSDYAMKNRTYRYMESEPLYPFGYGLSYTSFQYTELTTATQEVQAGQSILGRVRLTNTGIIKGREVVQIYLRDVEASVDVPHHALIDLHVVELNPGESKDLAFEVDPKAFSLINEQGQRIIEPGQFNLFVGGQQPDQRSECLTGQACLSISISVTGNTIVIPY